MTILPATRWPPHLRAARRFLRTPQGILLVVLAVLVALATPAEGATAVLPGILTAVVVAAALDLGLLWATRHKWIFPGGAVLSGLLIAMVLSPEEPWFVPPVSALVAVGSKRVVRLGPAPVFNPAALALLVSALLFGTAHSWWGALPALGPVGILAVAATGIFLADHTNKLPLVLAFMGSYFLFFTVASLAGDPANVAGVFRAPDLHAALFFALFMLTDPPTGPVRYRDQLQFALVIAAASYVVFAVLGAVYFLPAALLAGNLHEALRRLVVARAQRPAPAAEPL